MSEPAPTGLLHLTRPSLVRVIAVYAALTFALLAIPVLLAQPRAEAPHLSKHVVHDAPGRAR